MGMTRKSAVGDRVGATAPGLRAASTDDWMSARATMTPNGHEQTGNVSNRADQTYDRTRARRRLFAPTAHAALIPATAQASARTTTDASPTKRISTPPHTCVTARTGQPDRKSVV